MSIKKSKLYNYLFWGVDDNQPIEGLDGLRNARGRISSRLTKLQRLVRSLYIVSFIIILILAVVLAVGSSKYQMYALIFFYALLPLVMVPVVNQRIKEHEIRLTELDLQIDIETYAADNKDLGYAEKTLRSHNNEIMKYHNMNLRQNSWIFLLGLICIVLGFVLIVATFWAVRSINDDSMLQIELGLFGGVGSIMTNYIAALYLKMNAEVNGNMKEFHARLVETHKILLGNLIASKITDEVLRNQTLSEVAKEVAK